MSVSMPVRFAARSAAARGAGRRAALGLTLCLLLVAAPPLGAQPESEMPDFATLEAQFEELFAAAVAAPLGEPFELQMRWGAVLTAAAMVEMARGQQGLGPPADPAAAVGRVLTRWQELRPESAGPHVMRAVQIQDAAERRAAVLAVYDRFPHDALALSQAVEVLMQAGDAAEANRLAEAFLLAEPADSYAYRAVLQTVRDNETRRAEVLERWAAAVPGDPALVEAWWVAGGSVPSPEATRRVLGDFFARRPGGAADLDACLKVLDRGGGEFRQQARDCVVRTAGLPDLPPLVAGRAAEKLVEMAVADGDTAALTATLDRVAPESRLRALAAAAGSLETPARCDEVIALTSSAVAALGGAEDPYAAIAAALRGCGERPAAQAVVLDLLRRAESTQLVGVLSALGIANVNGVYRGELPPGAVAVLVARLEAEPDDGGLFAALDVAYQLDDPDDRRFDLLRRWYRRDPSALPRRAALDLAGGLLLRGDTAAAGELLAARLEERFEGEVAEALWAFHLETGGAEQAARFAADLAGAPDRWRSTTGQALLARSALLAGDVAGAEEHYWQALSGERPLVETAVELVVATGAGGEEQMRATAQRVCEETALGEYYRGVYGCVGELLKRAIYAGALVPRLPEPGEELPDEADALLALGGQATKAGRLELAELAYRRLVEVDPRRESGWTALGGVLEARGRVDELEALLEGARSQLAAPPVGLYRSAGRALAAAGRSARAVELLEEARALLPAGAGGDYVRSWIDHELRQVYRLLAEEAAVEDARQVAAGAPAGAASTAAAELPATATAEEIRRAADALQSGDDGRYDPAAAAALYRRAAALGDPRSAFRLALLQHFGLLAAGPGEADAAELHRRSVRQVEALAEGGDGYALYLVGSAAASGLGGAPDPARGLRLLRAAAEQGESWAWHNLGWAAQTGSWGAARDREAAIAAFRRGSELGNVQSMLSLAGLTLTAGAGDEACTEGLDWLRRSAATGNAPAAALLGKLLLYGRGECVAPRPAEAPHWLEAAAAERQPGAVYDLALALLVAGDGNAEARGMELLRQAAGEADAQAAEVLTLLHAAGLGVPRDPALAAGYLAQAASLGSDGFAGLRADAAAPPVAGLLSRARSRLEELAAADDAAAAALLARGYEVGLFGHRPERAVALARQAARGGEALAMRVLSAAYSLGHGVEADASESLRWLWRCAEAGDSFCMMFLGNDLLAGERQARDVAAGVGWLRRAGEAGNWWAIGDLARLYDRGAPGLPADRDEAAVWMRRRAALGDREAGGWLAHHGYR